MSLALNDHVDDHEQQGLPLRLVGCVMVLMMVSIHAMMVFQCARTHAAHVFRYMYGCDQGMSVVANHGAPHGGVLVRATVNQ